QTVMFRLPARAGLYSVADPRAFSLRDAPALKSFLRSVTDIYRRYLFLSKHHMVSPVCAVDLLWHAHMLHPGLYRAETAAATGQVNFLHGLNHDQPPLHHCVR